MTISAREAQIEPGSTVGLAPGDYIVLSVADTGQGMDAATLARAAEPFFTTKGTGKGTGLGLSMVHGLAAQSGGALRDARRPGEGACVALSLPRAEAPRPAPRRETVADELVDRAAPRCCWSTTTPWSAMAPRRCCKTSATTSSRPVRRRRRCACWRRP